MFDHEGLVPDRNGCTGIRKSNFESEKLGENTKYGTVGKPRTHTRMPQAEMLLAHAIAVACAFYEGKPFTVLPEEEQEKWWNDQSVSNVQASLRTLKIKRTGTPLISKSAKVKSMRSKTGMKIEIDENT